MSGCLPWLKLHEAPEILRKLADAIEAGVYGDPQEATAILNGGTIEVYEDGEMKAYSIALADEADAHVKACQATINAYRGPQ